MTVASRLPAALPPGQQAAILTGTRRAYQLLRHIELGEGEAADRLLGALATGREWVLLNLALTVLLNQTMRDLPPDRHLAWAKRRQSEVRDLGQSGPADIAAFSVWTFASAELCIELLTEYRPDRAWRLRFYEISARQAFDAEDLTGRSSSATATRA